MAALVGLGVKFYRASRSALFTFMEPALRVLREGEQAIRQALPVSFNWLLFGMALVLAVPMLDMGWRMRQRK